MYTAETTAICLHYFIRLQDRRGGKNHKYEEVVVELAI